MRNMIAGLIVGLFMPGISAFAAVQKVNGAPDQPFDRLSWLFAQFGEMPKGLMQALIAIAVVIVVMVLYERLFVREEVKYGSKQKKKGR